MPNTGPRKAEAAKGREWLRIVPDKTYDVGDVQFRFEVPPEIHPSLVPSFGQKAVRLGIDHMVRLNGWTFIETPRKYGIPQDEPVTYHVSLLQMDLDGFNLMRSREDFKAVSSGLATPKIACYARAWFIRDQIRVNLDEEKDYREQVNEADGFTSLAKMPEGSATNDQPRSSPSGKPGPIHGDLLAGEANGGAADAGRSLGEGLTGSPGGE